MKVLTRAIASIAALAALAYSAGADDYQCTSDTGCDALVSTDGGIKRVKFRKGDIVSTGSGWVVNPADGWTKVD